MHSLLQNKMAPPTTQTGGGRISPSWNLRFAAKSAFTAALLLWVIGIAAGGILLAMLPIAVPAAEDPLKSASAPTSAAVAAALCASIVLIATIVRCLRPIATLPATFSAAAVVLLAAGVSTRSLGALLMVAAMFALSWLIGDCLLRFLPPVRLSVAVRLPIAFALGLGIGSFLLFLLALVSQLNAVSVAVAIIGVVALIWLADREHMTARLNAVRSWRPASPSWFETIITALATALVTLALLTAFAPEDQTDAMRQHLPIAREIWQSGSATEFPPMSVSRRPMQAHLVYAVAYGFAGMKAAKLVQVAVGLCAIIGVAGIGWLCAGRLAAVTGAAIFATMPLVMWELGHAFIDLFPVLFTVAAALCVLLWQRDGFLAWLIAAGALSGFGLATKLTMGLVSAALAVAIVLIGRARWRWKDRVSALAAFAFGHVVLVPWLIRSYDITGTVPGLDTLQTHFGGVLSSLRSPIPQTPRPSLVADGVDGTSQAASQLGHSPLDLVRGLWVLTFDGKALGYPIIGRGEVGFLPLMLLPLTLLGARTRALALLAVTAAVSYFGWWLSSYQIARHLLPTLAIVAALGGIACASVAAKAMGWPARTLAGVTRAAIAGGCLAAALFFVASPRAQVPLDLLLGRESEAAYVDRLVSAAVPLAAASAVLPPDTPLGYVSVDWEGPQLYTEARLMYFPVDALGTNADQVLASLDQRGVRYFVWNRDKTRPEQWSSTLLSGQFLRDHARILAGDRNAYLIEVLPTAGLAWGATAPVNGLIDPGLETVQSGESPWTSEGKITRDGSGLSMPAKSAISQQAPVIGGHRYLLSIRGSCSDQDEKVELAIAWLDASDHPLGSAAEVVLPGVAADEQFLWRPAPANAALASVMVTIGKGSACDMERVELFDLDAT